jgi:hypothetical protein
MGNPDRRRSTIECLLARGQNNFLRRRQRSEFSHNLGHFRTFLAMITRQRHVRSPRRSYYNLSYCSELSASECRWTAPADRMRITKEIFEQSGATHYAEVAHQNLARA